MKEHPILMATNNVKAILEGRKTMTRRVIKNPAKYQGLMMEDEAEFWCPYGQVGDRLWVREAYCFTSDSFAVKPYLKYRAGGMIPANPENIPIGIEIYNQLHKDFPENIKWHPSIHMPRWASRITLEIAEVRVARLQEISLADIQAEGIPDDRATHNAPIQREKFKALWDKLNAKRGYGWNTNPWVWVVSFKKVAE